MESIPDAPVDTFGDEPGAALDAVRRAEAVAADRLTTPWWYHPALGALSAVLVLAYGSDRPWALPVGLVVFFAGVAALVSGYRRLTGMWISGLRAGRATRYAYALAVLLGACLLLAFVTGREGMTWPTWVAAATAFLGTIVIGWRFDAVLRAEIRSGHLRVD
jgi:drug/metabolite transporter (DMT)-like permease